MLLRLEGVAKSFGAHRLFEGVDLVVNAGDRIGLVGPNGAGKTTLLRLAAGLESPDAGRRLVSTSARVAMLRQEIDPSTSRTVREEASSALHHLEALAEELQRLEGRMAALGRDGSEVPQPLAERYDRARRRFELEGGFEREARVDRVLQGLGFEGDDRERPLSSFSGGWLMRVELAKLLLSDPDVLLLDEPTNHLDLPSIQWFEETLSEFRGGVVAVSHDRTFLRRQVSRIAELSTGRLAPYEMGFDRYLEERERRREALLARKRTQERKIAQADRFIERFRAKASKASQVQSRIKARAKLEPIELPSEAPAPMRLRIPPVERAGELVVTLEGVHKRYGDTRVYAGVDLQIRRGERVALVGPNGAGKSTLLRILAGVLPPDAGTRALGHNVTAVFFAQHQLEALDSGRTVLAELERVARSEDHPRLRGHLGAFLFSGDAVEKKVGVLSGGEKARLALAKLLLRPANLLVLDEPTNHLDMQACDVLENALGDYAGTLVFISHDRAFVNALATRVIEIRAGRLRDFLGNYDDYLRRVAEAPGASGARGALPGHGRPGPDAASAPGVAPTDARDGRERRRLSRERRRSRERLARRIEALEAEILDKERGLEALGWKLGDPELFRDPERVRALEAERDTLRGDIDTAYRRWEQLADELEGLDSGTDAAGAS